MQILTSPKGFPDAQLTYVTSWLSVQSHWSLKVSDCRSPSQNPQYSYRMYIVIAAEIRKIIMRIEWYFSHDPSSSYIAIKIGLLIYNINLKNRTQFFHFMKAMLY